MLMDHFTALAAMVWPKKMAHMTRVEAEVDSRRELFPHRANGATMAPWGWKRRVGPE